MLHLDHVGIGASIYSLTTCLAYVFFHSEPNHRDNIISGMLVLYFCNGIIQLLPCYAAEQFLLHKNILFLACAISTIILAVVWTVSYADQEEIQNFGLRLLWAYIQIVIGFFFFVSHYPEKAFPNSRFVHLYLQSHIWWHVFVHTSAATLFWLLYDYQLYLEKLPKGVQN